MADPEVLLSGVLLNTPMGGALRPNAELLPRVATLLESAGGGLSVMEGSKPVSFPLPASVRRLPTRVPANPRLLRVASEGFMLRNLLDQSSRRFDLIHFAHIPVPRRLPLPFTLTLHDMRSFELAEAPKTARLVAKELHRSAVKRASLVVTVSETVAAALMKNFDISDDRIRIVPNAGDHFAVLPRRFDCDAPILHVGHLERRKNIELLIRAIALDAGLPPISLAGIPKDDEEERLRRLAEDLGVSKRVTFLGRFDESELPELYSRAACVAIPSKLEGFGIGVLEAQLAGVPLCISHADALNEVAGSHVPRFHPEDPAECARAIREALSLPTDQIELNRAQATRFSWDQSAEAFRDIWVEAVSLAAR